MSILKVDLLAVHLIINELSKFPPLGITNREFLVNPQKPSMDVYLYICKLLIYSAELN